MPPYEIRVKAVYDGKNLILREPVPVSEGTEMVVRLDVEPLGMPPGLSAEERLSRLHRLRPLRGEGTNPDVEISRDDPEMYPDR
jgi:hypothetical protein